MIASFCLICARRYSRLLTGKGEYSSLEEDKEEVVKGVWGPASWDKQNKSNGGGGKDG
jgi:hypothetical protein